MENEKNKICTGCNTLKPLSEFYKDSSKKDGVEVKCKLCKKIQKAKYYILNRDKLCAQSRIWAIGNKEKVRTIRRKTQIKREYLQKTYEKRKKKRNTDPLFKLADCVRSRINKVFRGESKSKKTLDILGCTFKELIKYTEKLFQPGMSWENHGRIGWHIDHIIPLSSAKNKEELLKLCHYTNLQPLWALDNLKKSNKIS
jgi:5-methylcytosine-specific restriction endonuclease McrA